MGAPKPSVSPLMIANVKAVSAATPISAPAVSTRCASGSALSGSTSGPAASAASPKARLNQKMPRQLQTPTSAPPIDRPGRQGQAGHR